MVRKFFPELTFINLEKNIGASARNIGLKRAAADIVVTLDDDVTGLDDRSIDYLTELFRYNPKLGALNFQIRDYFTGRICNWVHHKKEEEYADKEFSTYEITEGAVAFRKSALETAGYYPDDFFISHEGPDLACRILDHGYEIAYSGKISVRHRHENTGRKDWYNYYYDTRNVFWLAARNFPATHALRYITRSLLAMMIYSVRDGFFSFWLKGVRDGIAGAKGAMRNRKVLSNQTMDFIKSIDKGRPNIFYTVNKRFFKTGVRL
jgi:GT2 family glycosyltransferase